MEIIVISIYAILSSTLIIISYTLGLKNGQKLRNNERIEIPKVVEPLKELISKEETKGLTDEQLKEWENINNYNGSDENQITIE